MPLRLVPAGVAPVVIVGLRRGSPPAARLTSARGPLVPPA